MTYPDHHEGIRGTDRTDWLLSLDENALAHRDAIAALAYHLEGATIVGNPAPSVANMNQRMRRPQVGDFVYERSMFRRDDVDTLLKRFGILLAVRTEWFTTNAVWEAEKTADPGLSDEDRNTDTAWYVQYGNSAGDVCRWANCRFTAVPTVWDFFEDTRSEVAE